MQTNRQLGKF